MRRDKTIWRLREATLSYSLLVSFISVFQRSVFQALRGGEENNDFYTIVDAKTEMGKRSHVVLKSCCLLMHVQKYPLTVRLILKEGFDSPMHSPT